MTLTIQEAHTYYNMVNSGDAPKLEFPGVDNTPGGSFILPAIDKNDQVYFFDAISKAKIYPGLDMIKKIKDCIAKIENP